MLFSPSRRTFLKQGATGLTGALFTGLARSGRAADTKEVSDHGMNSLIDAHVHLWTNDFKRYPLAAGFKPEDMKPPVFLPENILALARPAGVGRIVLVQMSYYGFDNSYMLDVISQSPDVFRGIAIVDWESPNPDVTMRQLVKQAKQRVRGFRVYSKGNSPAAWISGSGLEKMFRCGAEDNLAICALINPQELPALDRQCKKFSDTPVIIDHLARIGMAGPIKDSDIQALCGFARRPQVKVKVSAFYALGKRKPPHLDLAPLIKRLYETFGPERLMWASDCPFQVMSETYEDSISLVRDRLDFLSLDDKSWILRKTAEQFFFTS